MSFLFHNKKYSNINPFCFTLQVKYAEIRMAVRPTSQSKSFIVRLCISNDAGYILNMNIYKEVADPQTGVLKFISFGPEQVSGQYLLLLEHFKT